MDIIDDRHELQLSFGHYRRLRIERGETDNMEMCPNPANHAESNFRGNNPSKSGSWLINCIGGHKDLHS